MVRKVLTWHGKTGLGQGSTWRGAGLSRAVRDRCRRWKARPPSLLPSPASRNTHETTRRYSVSTAKSPSCCWEGYKKDLRATTQTRALWFWPLIGWLWCVSLSSCLRLGNSFCDALTYTIAFKINNSSTIIENICVISQKLVKDEAAGHLFQGARSK